MTTYYKLDHSEPGYLSQMLPRADGTWVKRADYYADFAAAHAENQRLTKERDEARAQAAAAFVAAEKALESRKYGDPDEREEYAFDAALDRGIVAIRALTPDDAKAALEAYGREKVREGMPGRAGSSEAAWQDVTALPDPKEGPFMVSNLPNAVNSHGRPSHVFCVRSIHKDEDGSFCAFDGYRKIWGITRYYPISSPALPQETKNDQ